MCIGGEKMSEARKQKVHEDEPKAWANVLR